MYIGRELFAQPSWQAQDKGVAETGSIVTQSFTFRDDVDSKSRRHLLRHNSVDFTKKEDFVFILFV